MSQIASGQTYRQRIDLANSADRFFTESAVIHAFPFESACESWDICIPGRKTTGFYHSYYEDIAGPESERRLFHDRFEQPSFEPVMPELDQRAVQQRVFIACVAANSTLTGENLVIVADVSEEPLPFCPDFAAIRKWVNLVFAGNYPTIREDSCREEVGILAEYASPDILCEVQRENLEEAIESAVAISRKLFRNLHGIRIGMACDPEISGRKTFRIILTVSGNPGDVLTEDRNLKKRLYTMLAPEEREKITVTYEWGK